jgi:putative transcriptional regulator
MEEAKTLAGHLLLAMPGMTDPNFAHAVTYICEHTEEGALGIVINKPMDMDFGEILQQLSLATGRPELAAQPVLRGGPVQMERGFVLHDSANRWDTTTEIGHSIFVTTSQDILTDVAAGKGPDHLLIALGYAGWGAGQLEAELRQNAWLTVPASVELVFRTPCEMRWQAAAKSLGINPAHLSLTAGNA